MRDVSICIPTYNRADLLDYCLSRLPDDGYEIVVSDNASTDGTPEVVAAHQRSGKNIRYFRHQKTVGVEGNLFSSYYQATRKYVVYIADDDALIPGALSSHVERLSREPDIVALYTDFVAWDDANDREIHRYMTFPSHSSFTPDKPTELLNFVFQHQIYPEIGIFHRETFLKSHVHVKHGVPHHLWMYQMFRRGRIVFDMTPYYRENRTLKPMFKRDYWTNMDGAFKYVGDEMRCTLETLCLWAFRDAKINPDRAIVRAAIDQFLHAKTKLEVIRAAGSGNPIRAMELLRRLQLWYGLPADHQLERLAAAQSNLETLLITGGSEAIFESENYR